MTLHLEILMTSMSMILNCKGGQIVKLKQNLNVKNFLYLLFHYLVMGLLVSIQRLKGKGGVHPEQFASPLEDK